MPTCLKIKFVKIEFENSFKRLSFFCCLMDINIAWTNPWKHKKSGHRTNSWSKQGKNLHKNCQKVHVFLFAISIYFCFSKTTYLAAMISTINKVKELSAGVSEAKICLKLVKKTPYIHIYNFKIITSVNIYTVVFS